MGYIQSKNIKVYPTANRKQPFDPESIYRSEANSVLANKLISPNKQGSYVLTETYDSTKPLEFVLGGYYFKIKDPSVITEDNKDYYCVGIIVDYRSPEQSEEQDRDNTEFSSKILKNLEGIVSGINAPNNCLDDSTNSFTGLYIYSNSTSIDTSKFTHTLRLLEKQNDAYFIPQASKFNFDTRLIRDFNNPTKYLSDYFLSNEFKNTPGWITTRKVHADEIKTTKVSSLQEIKLSDSKLKIINESGSNENTNLNFNAREVNFNNMLTGSFIFNKDLTCTQKITSDRIATPHIMSSKVHCSRNFIETQYLSPSWYKITSAGKMRNAYEDIPYDERWKFPLTEDLILYSPTFNRGERWDQGYDPSWDAKGKFFEKQDELDYETLDSDENPSTRDLIERVRFGGLGNLEGCRDYPYMSISNFYNKAGNDMSTARSKDFFGWTEIGGKPIKAPCQTVPRSDKEYNVTRYVATDYNSSKLSSDGLTLHSPLRTATPKCETWTSAKQSHSGDKWEFSTVITNINSFVYMNEKSIGTSARPKTETDVPTSASSGTTQDDPRYQISGKFGWASGLVLGTGFVNITLDENKLPSDCRGNTADERRGDVAITRSPIPIVIANGVDPKNFDTDKDLTGTEGNTVVLLDSQGYSHLNLATSSDERLKYNIHNYYPVNSILDVPVKEFTYKKDNRTTIGFVAQDLQKYFPQLVKEDDQGYLMINESKIVYLLLDEVKKLRREIDELKK